MKLFKLSSTTATDDGYQILIRDLQATTAELNSVYTNLQNVVEPDVIDYYIYQAKAVSMRYKFLLECVKKIEDSYAKNPL